MADIEGLGQRLSDFWSVFGGFTVTKTRDTSEYGYHYLSGLLRLPSDRTIAHISRTAGVPEQNMQHYISQSPWSGQEMLKHIRTHIVCHPHFEEGSVLILDESADDRAGKLSAGVGRQYNGRLGKVDLCQVGVFLSIAKDGMSCWIDGVLFLPEDWFTDEYAEMRRKVGVPKEQTFATKLELGWQLIERAKQEDVPFVALACDEFYGRSFSFRQQMNEGGIEYYADIPANTRVYLSSPTIGVPNNRRGPKATKERVLSPRPIRVDQLRNHAKTLWHSLTIRPTERGMLTADFARVRVWLVDDDDLAVSEEWLLIRRDGKKHTYSLSNAPILTSLKTMASRKTQRYFIERSNQDAKSEFGWDEFQATKVRAWEHQLTFTVLAQWFITQTRLDWAEQCEDDPDLLRHYEVTILPTLSVANVRSLLRAALPLPQLSPLEAAALVVKHLDNRTRSRKSRMLNHSGP